jgi:inosine-uridine nucleoside N-ribohydrolase
MAKLLTAASRNNHCMEINRTFYFFILAGIALLISCHNPVVVKKEVSVIFDTDIGPDYDDVGAIATLHALADSGECRILATMASNGHTRIVHILGIMNNYFNQPELPIGMVNPPIVNLGAKQHWDSLLVARYPGTLTDNDQAENAVKLYRKLLASEPDTSVTIVTVGFLTNLSGLLQSEADEFSPLTGKELVRGKVKLLVSMAARFDSLYGKFREFNVMKDSLSAKMVFDNWPGPILFSGFEIGKKIHTGLPIAGNASIQHSPVKDVFAWSIPQDPEDSLGRMSWDETAVLVAVRGYEKYFDVKQGRIVSHLNGSTGWDSTGTRDRYLVFKMPVPELESIINTLIMHQPVKH